MEGADRKTVNMLFYTTHITPRIQYMVQYMNQQLGVEAVVTDDAELYRSHRSEKINYSAARILDEEFWMAPVGLLSSAGVQKQAISCFTWQGLPAFFATDDDLGFDWLAASFFLITRYEEYLEHEPDAYGRYAHHNSTAWNCGFLQRPLVDEWTERLRRLLKQKFPLLTFSSPSFHLLPTYDIDIAWSYRHKGFWRTLGGIIRQPNSVVKRIQVLAGRRQDPYDALLSIAALHREYSCRPLTFFLAADHRSELDKNVDPHSKAFHSLVLQFAEFSDIGVHPSDFSNTHQEYLVREKNTLEACLKKTIYRSRHHYLKIHLPHSYRTLLQAGITDDYTMGYGTVNGFRASTSRSFYWYDLEAEAVTPLRVHPPAWMEANSYYELHQKPEEAFAELNKLYEQVQATGGTFITVMHNHFLGTDEMYAGWGERYAEFIRNAASANK